MAKAKSPSKGQAMTKSRQTGVSSAALKTPEQLTKRDVISD
jgi:hypothetical protein